ncbi:RNA polymerase sigma factor [Pararcticibacter amylolyticus]|uniref:RNA polymerase sigma factor n=1 Tax=Pararcticibacter amylolyticus TaxID=2173175 RepID=A0A2U2PF06_9SPHI|nr:RNA polymerase sigma factor [Pararcticibacter amylolyticus]PWG79963.1 hypothetical protein DDR33_14285 [Pararcticibacter amylolyticus]
MNISTSPSLEHLLLEKASNGDRRAYAELYSTYAPKLYRFVFPFADQSKENTEEVVQDVFLKIWAKREMLKTVRSFEAYIFRVAKNQLIDNRKRQESLRKIINTFGPETESESALDKVIYDEYNRAAQEAIGRLSPQRRRIFEMRVMYEMGIDEIACQLNISQSAVKKQLYEARDFIKVHLHQSTGWPLVFIAFCKVFCSFFKA